MFYLLPFSIVLWHISKIVLHRVLLQAEGGDIECMMYEI